MLDILRCSNSPLADILRTLLLGFVFIRFLIQGYLFFFIALHLLYLHIHNSVTW